MVLTVPSILGSGGLVRYDTSTLCSLPLTVSSADPGKKFVNKPASVVANMITIFESFFVVSASRLRRPSKRSVTTVCCCASSMTIAP